MFFAATAGVVLFVGQHFVARAQLRQRLAGGPGGVSEEAKARSGPLDSVVDSQFTEERFGIDSTARQKLRRELIRAGFFGVHAVRYYVFARLATVVAAPLITFIILMMAVPTIPNLLLLLLVSVMTFIGALLPDAYLSRRQTRLQREYRLIFPDLLDLMVVCVSAGLSVEGSFERVRSQVEKRSPHLGGNLQLMGAEMRAGRSTVEALNSFADRLGLDEATSFAVVIRHSIELGGDISEALRVYSDEMRDKRMLRAEELANALPVKIVIPLALGIFPVILTIVLLPVILKLIWVFRIT
jgi:tight adherence protein C